MSLKLVVVRMTSWREGVLLGRPRVLPDRSRVYARIDALGVYTRDRIRSSAELADSHIVVGVGAGFGVLARESCSHRASWGHLLVFLVGAAHGV